MSRPPPAYPPRSRLSNVSTSGRWAGDAHGEHQRVHSTPPLTVDWDDDDGASTQGGGHYVDSVYSDTHHYGDEDPLERLSGGSDFSGDSGYSVFSGDSGYTGLSGVSGAFHNRSLLPARVKGDPRLDPTDPDYDPNEHLRRLTEGDTVDDADRFSLARGLSLGLGSSPSTTDTTPSAPSREPLDPKFPGEARRGAGTRSVNDTETSRTPRTPRRRGTRAR